MSKESAAAQPSPRYKPYPTYKDSGVEWLGQIPAHWSAKKIKRLCHVKRGASPRPIDDSIYFDDDGEFAWVRISDVTASDKYLLATEQKLSSLGKSKSVALQPGELFLSIAATVGKPMITKIKCCIHDGFVYFVGLGENREFLFYLFSTGELYKGVGKVGTQLNLNTDTIGDLRIPIPPWEEQSKAVSFLDRETAKIDALVAKKERLIELLEEKRTALITHAVTKGLPSTGSGQADPNVPMKDSGVEWLGKIPAHWVVKRVKWAAKMESGHTPDKKVEAYWNNCDIPWVSLNDTGYLKNHDYISETAYQVNALGLENSSARLLPAKAVVFSRDATVGLCAITTRPMAVSQHFIAWLCGPALMPEYLLYVFRSMTQELERLTMGATIMTIGMPDVKTLSTPIPPTTEQERIVRHIRQETKEIDSLIAKVREGIERLREYRTALISAAVTGKIDLREDVA